MLQKLSNFLSDYYNFIEPKSKKANLAYFNASISGFESDYEEYSKYQLEISKYYSNKELFNTVKEIKNSGEITDHVQKRELDLIYNECISNQCKESLNEEIIKLSTSLEQKFSVFRTTIEDREVTDNEIDEILENSFDSSELERAWNASKQIGEVVANDVVNLVKLRNKGAIELGFDNFHEMSLSIGEQSSVDLDNLFDELDELTRGEFIKLKKQMDEFLSEKYSISPNELMPWHYEDKFFQTGPKLFNANLKNYFEDEDLVKLTQEYYNGIGLNIDDLIDNSDLYEKKGKYQHAYCTDIDRSGDVRVLCNIKPNDKWMSTMLHEFGHAVYDKHISRKLPWQLRSHSHIFTTEAIAMMFGRLSQNPEWLNKMGVISIEESSSTTEQLIDSLRLEQLIFSRWVQVMYRFEKEMYSNPDQDLNSLWWQLVEKYQLLKKPESRDKPDWAAKIHLALYPAYYHNYLLGELLASQLYSYITRKVLHSENEIGESFVKKIEVGDYLKNQFFSYGALYPWNEIIKKATGEKLTPRYYAAQFVK